MFKRIRNGLKKGIPRQEGLLKGKIKYTAIVLAGSLAAIAGCQKVVHGYLSDDIYYQVNPFDVQQGVTTVSAALVLNGSTAPLHVDLLALRDADGNDADSVFTTPRKIVTYKSSVNYTDTTLEMLEAKLNDSLVSPFNLGEIGGRLQFTAATAYVPTGTYNMDIKVSNVNGSKIIKNACAINITGLATPYSIGYFSYRPYDDEDNMIFRTESDPYYSTVDIDFDAESENQIILKFVDKNGVAFNPNKGEVKDFSNESAATTYFPTLHMWAPFYSQVYTDSSIIQKLPDVNLSFPYFSLPNYAAGGGVRIDNKISGMKGYAYVQMATYFALNTRGTYTITVHLLQDTHK